MAVMVACGAPCRLVKQSETEGTLESVVSSFIGTVRGSKPLFRQNGEYVVTAIWRPVVSDFSIDEVQVPIALVMVHEASKDFPELLVHDLGLTISLRVVGRQGLDFSP